MKTEKDLGALGLAIVLRTWKATPGLEGPLATNSSFLSLCVCVCECAIRVWCLWKPEGGDRSAGAA